MSPHTDLLPHMLTVDGNEAPDHTFVYELRPENLELCFTESQVTRKINWAQLAKRRSHPPLTAHGLCRWQT